MSVPRGWVEAPLGEVVEVLDNRRVPVNAGERERRQGPFPYYGANGQAGTIDGYLFDGDYVLLAEDGGNFDDHSRGVAYRATGKFWVNNHAHVLATRDGMPVPFLLHQLNALDWMPYVTGTTRLKLTQGAMARVPIRIAPLQEQHRIVAMVEDVIAHSRQAKDALEAVGPRLEELRQSILAAAFRGDLTADWRARNSDVEPAEKMLARIRTERRKRWEEAELAKMKAKGRGPTDARWSDRYVEPEPVGADAPELPDGWVWASLETLSFLVGGLAKGQKRKGTERLRAVPYLRVANVQRGHLDMREVREIDATEEEIEELRLLPGDMLLNEGGDRDKLGRGWIWSGELPECIHQNHVFRARPVGRELEPAYLSDYANTFGQTFFVDAGKQTTNLASVSMSKVRRFPVALPPAAEQREIVRVLTAHLAGVRRQRDAIDEAATQLKRLEGAILTKAFRGELVPQDPNDEPADAMLARVRAASAQWNGKLEKHLRGSVAPKSATTE